MASVLLGHVTNIKRFIITFVKSITTKIGTMVDQSALSYCLIDDSDVTTNMSYDKHECLYLPSFKSSNYHT